MSKTKLDYEEDDLGILSNKLEVYKEQYVSTRYRVFIDEGITDPSYYRDVLNVLASAKEEDVVEFRLNTGGGQLRSALPIMNAITSTEARTIAVVEGLVASAGTFILLACDDVIIKPLSGAMVHAPRFGALGTMQEMKTSLDYDLPYCRRVCEEIYAGFLLPEEIIAMVEDSKEYYMDEEELLDRLKKRQKYQEDAMAEMIAAQEKATLPPKKPAAKKRPTRKTTKPSTKKGS